SRHPEPKAAPSLEDAPFPPSPADGREVSPAGRLSLSTGETRSLVFPSDCPPGTVSSGSVWGFCATWWALGKDVLSERLEERPSPAENTQRPGTSVPSHVPSRRSPSPSREGPSGQSRPPDRAPGRALPKSIRHRMLYLSEQLRVEQARRDENTASYLKLVSKADRHRAPHVRQAFEKVNQRTSATIARIEQRLRQCHRQLQELEEGGRPKGLVPTSGSPLDDCGQPGQTAPGSEAPRPSVERAPAQLPNADRHSAPGSPLPGGQQGESSEAGRVARPSLRLQKVKEELEAVEGPHARLQEASQSLAERRLRDLQVSLESLQKERCR
ncbi:testis-specific protein TEX28-like, partial [Carlito syrichta]|uniref:Testis-specific protein TEX28-like n=1 Tax=Carlito syrichta TaxID=1868482 RepID=A0A3Q0E1M3_CARSF